MLDTEKVGKFIKEIREKNHLTQQQLANKYGVTYQAVSKWERGINLPEVSLLREMSKDFNVSLDDILDGECSKKSNPKKQYILIIIISLIIIIGLIIGIMSIIKLTNKENSFEFKTISSVCKNFTISGNISYNTSKSSIYITNINYCGGNDFNQYDQIECILYEINGDKEIEISTYKSKIEKITLEEFLKNVSFVIDNYNSICKKYKKDSFKLLIKAKLEDKTINYDIPLSLNDECN